MPRVMGYGSHVEKELLQAARDAGCDPVLPRSQFVRIRWSLEGMAGRFDGRSPDSVMLGVSRNGFPLQLRPSVSTRQVMRFTKMHGIGNDYVYVDCVRNPPPADPAALSRADQRPALRRSAPTASS